MTEIPELMDIYHFKCDNEGRQCSLSNKWHYFIICSEKEYNKGSTHVVGVPITSEITYYSLNYGSDITNEMLTLPFLDKKSFVLQDRPCRINKNDLRIKKSGVHPKIYKNIIKNISGFLEGQNIKDKNLMS